MPVKSTQEGSTFLIQVIMFPTEAERIEGAKPTLVVEPKYIFAPDAEAARNKAVLLIPRDLDVDRCEVQVSLPFGR